MDNLRAGSESGQPEAVVGFCSIVLELSRYPEGFPKNYRVAYVPEAEELVIDYELPTCDVVPEAAEYRT